MITGIYIGSWRVDQFGDESPKIISSVQDIKDITKNTTDYSASYTVPASPRNNILFKHWYDANIDNSFDARITIDGRITLDDQTFKTGKFRLHKVNLKKGVADSYTINFNGLLNGIKELASDKKLKDLDLTAYDHDYDSDTVKDGFQNGLFSGDVIYNLLVKKQYYINENAGDNTQTDRLANISWDGGPNTGIIWNDLRPSLRLIKFIEAIEILLGITFSRHFFGTSEFTGLFMWLNSDKESEIVGNRQIIDWDVNTPTLNAPLNLVTNIGTYQTDNSSGSNDRLFWRLYLTVTPEPAFSTVVYTINWYVNGELFLEITNNIGTYTTPFFEPLVLQSDGPVTHNSYFEIVTEQEFQYTASLYQEKWLSSSFLTSWITTASVNIIESIFVLSDNLPDLKIIDFLKGLFNMYKLVIIPTTETDYYVNTQEGYYSEGLSYDISKHINWESIDIERGEILNEILFKFSEPQTILNLQYKANNGVGYGDEDLRLYTDATETKLLEGGSLKVELPFEQVVYEHLIDQDDNQYSQTQYGAIIDESGDPTNIKAHLFYSSRGSIGSKKLAFIEDDGTRVELIGSMHKPIHGSGLLNPSFTTTFAANISTWDGYAMTNNLYTNHWKQYVLDIFNIKKRTTKVKAVLPLWLILRLNLNDILKIKDKYYRIDKYVFDLKTKETEFDLINSFDTVVNPFIPSTSNVYTDYAAKTEQISITNLDGATPTKVDVGFGVGWVTVTISATLPNVLNLVFDENLSGLTRDMFVNLVATDGKTASIYLNQTPGGVTFDSDEITFDSDLITFDRF